MLERRHRLTAGTFGNAETQSGSGEVQRLHAHHHYGVVNAPVKSLVGAFAPAPSLSHLHHHAAHIKQEARSLNALYENFMAPQSIAAKLM